MIVYFFLLVAFKGRKTQLIRMFITLFYVNQIFYLLYLFLLFAIAKAITQSLWYVKYYILILQLFGFFWPTRNLRNCEPCKYVLIWFSYMICFFILMFANWAFLCIFSLSLYLYLALCNSTNIIFRYRSCL